MLLTGDLVRIPWLDLKSGLMMFSIVKGCFDVGDVFIIVVGLVGGKLATGLIGKRVSGDIGGGPRA